MDWARVAIKLGCLRHAHTLSLEERGDILGRERLNRSSVLPCVGSRLVLGLHRDSKRGRRENQSKNSRLHSWAFCGISLRTMARIVGRGSARGRERSDYLIHARRDEGQLTVVLMMASLGRLGRIAE